MPTRPDPDKLASVWDEELGRRRCTATTRAGSRCKRAPIPGGYVCKLHGGGAPQVRRAAALRLAELVDPSIGVLERIVEGPTAEWQRLEEPTVQRAGVWKRVGFDPAVQKGAAEAVLDRTGYHRRVGVEAVDASRERILERLRELAAEHGLELTTTDPS